MLQPNDFLILPPDLRAAPDDLGYLGLIASVRARGRHFAKSVELVRAGGLPQVELGVLNSNLISMGVSLDAIEATLQAIKDAQITRDDYKEKYTVISSTAETTILTAEPGKFLDLTILHIRNKSDTDVLVDFRDDTAGTIRDSFMVPAKDTRGFNDGERFITQTVVNKPWTAKLGTAVTDVGIFAQAVKKPL